MSSGLEQFLMRRSFQSKWDVLRLAILVAMALAAVTALSNAIGAAVSAVLGDLITPLVAAIVGKLDVSSLQFVVNGSMFQIGRLINAMVSFVLIAAVVYFLVLLPLRAIVTRWFRGTTSPDSATKRCPECLSSIPLEARRCAFCTSPVNLA